MGVIALLFILMVATRLVEGHNAWVRVAVNGKWARPFEFIRNLTAPFEELERPSCTGCNPRCYVCPTWADYDYPQSVRCGRDNMAHAADTDVLRVKAGDELTFLSTTLAQDAWQASGVQWDGCPDGKGVCTPGRTSSPPDRVYHNGPIIAHLSKVPEGQDVHEYDGSGKWTKIYTMGATLVTDVDREDIPSPYFWKGSVDQDFQVSSPPFKFQIPKQTPAGQYLLRMDSVNIGMHTMPKDGSDWIWQSGETQVYPGCAQIEVQSDYTGSLPEGGVQIPEALFTKSPGMSLLGVSGEFGPGRYQRIVLDPEYVYPGGPLWDGEKLVQDRILP
jgi:hypothetical protein